jgi:flavin reductase (DIM6/NTAB) family NADH-FMN oxidoreductase RutF
VNDFDHGSDRVEFSPMELRQTLAHFPTGVTVVTVLDDDGQLHGLTASSFTSVSLDPPLILVCVGYGSRSYPIVARQKRLAVHVLADDQTVAERGCERRAACEWTVNSHGCGILGGYLVLFECRLVDEHCGGDHAILVCRVEGINTRDSKAKPLLFHRGRLGRIDHSGCQDLACGT